MKINWKKQHKWSSLACCFFLFTLCLSGILLNHRGAVADYDVSRSLLPPHYRYHHWNGGLLRGSLDRPDGSTLLYGASGIWRIDSAGCVSDFNNGLPAPAHFRNIRNVTTTPDGHLFALSTTALYHLSDKWERMDVGDTGDVTLSDITCHGDSLVVLSRSDAFLSTDAGRSFRKIEFPVPIGADISRTTAFQTVWRLHSGQLFGTPGVMVADAVAVILLFLTLSGVLIWLLPIAIRRRAVRHRPTASTASLFKFSFRYHRAVGVWTLVLTMLICVTGWALRPPVLIGLVKLRMTAPKGTTLDVDNPWHDKLRMIRYDADAGRWLLNTSEGFFALDSLDGVPHKISAAPPVSVMGLNVWQSIAPGRWLVGSFSGAFVWDPAGGVVTDYFTGKRCEKVSGIPFGKTPVAGFYYCGGRPELVNYDTGIASLPQPESLTTLPMSLWNVALETHTGRIFFGNSATYFYIFLTGILVFWSLLSGYKIHRKKP